MPTPALEDLLDIIPSQGQANVRVKWYYKDDSDTTIVNPSAFLPFTGRLFDPTDSQRSPANTAIATASTFTPILDTDGGFYVDVTFDPLAPLGVWYIQSEFVWEGKQRIQEVGFLLTSAGATMAAGGNLYCSADDVSRFMSRKIVGFDANTFLTRTDVEDLIRIQMGVVDDYVQRSFRPNQATELLDVTYADKWKLNGDYLASARTTHSPVILISSIKAIVAGQEVDLSAVGPNRAGQTWYFHDRSGWIYLIGATLPSAGRKGLQVTYSWGEPSIPPAIRGATYRLVAAELLESENYAVELPEESDTAGYVAEKVERWRKQAFEMLDRQVDPVYSISGG